MSDYRLRLSRRVLGFLEGTGAWAASRDGDPAFCDWLHDVVKTAPARTDGSVTVPITIPIANELWSYVGAMQANAEDNTWDADGRADLIAARACMKALDALPTEES